MYDMLDQNLALKAAREAAKEARQVLLDYFGRLSKVSEKDQAGLVSEADVEAEEVIASVLRRSFPDFSMLGEENSYRTGQVIQEKGRRGGLWLVDPLDGTTNYVHKFPVFCISIGLEFDGVLEIGVIDVPIMQKTFYGIRGQGAFSDDERNDLYRVPLNVSDRKTINEALLATGFSSYDKEALQDQLAIFGSLVDKTRGIRRAGSAAYDLALVAEGVFDCYWEKNLQPWDMAAGALLVQEAGGVVTNYEGDSFVSTDRSIIAGSREMHGMVLDTVKKSCQKSARA